MTLPVVRKWLRRGGRARSNLFAVVPAIFLGRLQANRYGWTPPRLVIVLRWGFWEASAETWREEDATCPRCAYYQGAREGFEPCGAAFHGYPDAGSGCSECGHEDQCHPQTVLAVEQEVRA